VTDAPVSSLHWRPSWRVIPTRYPEINLWSRIAVPGDEPAIQEIEGLTNNRLRQLSGEIQVLRAGDFFRENCPDDVMASFVYPKPSRFTTLKFGAFYASLSLKTALFEKAHWTLKLLKDAQIPSTRAQMRVIKAEIKAKVQDLRGMKKVLPALYDPDHYTSSQQFAAEIWRKGAQGIAYDSVRHPGGQCVAVFSPQTITHCRKDRVLTFEWNGVNTIDIVEIKEFLKFQEP
jgi:hypothetical protein